jgi:hypothetical protein
MECSGPGALSGYLIGLGLISALVAAGTLIVHTVGTALAVAGGADRGRMARLLCRRMADVGAILTLAGVLLYATAALDTRLDGPLQIQPAAGVIGELDSYPGLLVAVGAVMLAVSFIRYDGPAWEWLVGEPTMTVGEVIRVPGVAGWVYEQSAPPGAHE